MLRDWSDRDPEPPMNGPTRMLIGALIALALLGAAIVAWSWTA